MKTAQSPRTDQELMQVKSVFVDYNRFEGDGVKRKIEKDAFKSGIKYTPDFDYPKLDAFYDANEKSNPIAEKTAVYEAVLELEARRKAGDTPEALLELFADFYQNRLQKIMLVESARRMKYPGSNVQVARQEFMRLNEALYGEYDFKAYSGMISTEKQRFDSFEPSTDLASDIKNGLAGFFENKTSDIAEPELLRPEFLDRMKGIVDERYGEMLSVVPDTDETSFYDAQQCRDIIQEALEIRGLAAQGWRVEVDPNKSVPATNRDDKKIYLPADTSRTASQLRKLTIHEAGIHAVRAQNGEDTGLMVLAKGIADYADVEEGLGVFLECVLDGDLDNPSFHRARDRYITAGIILGGDDAPRDARQSFEILWRMLAMRTSPDGAIDEKDVANAKTQAMLHIENAFRGTDFAGPGIIYTKLKVYYEGLKKNADYFAEADDLGQALDTALIAKYDHTNEAERQNVESLTLAA